MQELSRVRQSDQTSRPLRIRPQDPVHKPDDTLKKVFESDARDEMEYRKLNTKDWLRLGTWWLLKARFHLRSSKKLDSTKSCGSSSVSNDPKSPANQAYVDLLKASWIIYELVLRENVGALHTDENRKLFYNLSDGVREELDLFRPVDIPDQQTLKEQKIDCSIWEHLQPEEESHDDELLIMPLDNGRWITAEQDDAGEDGEDVLFRTFIDAAIGGKKRRVRSKGAPYMLILSTKEGESEPKVTLCNQSGSLCVTRDFLVDDLQEEIATPTSPIPGMGLVGGVKSLPLNFGLLEVVSAFTNEDDLQRFMQIPRNYFKVVKRREPRHMPNATEVTLFRSSVEVVEKLKPTSMLLESRKHHWSSCDLRVLETTGKVGWKTTRRLVLSSSAGEDQPWCTEYFLPLSRVQVSREGLARQVLIKWSDCSNEKSDRTDGKYHPLYDYVYDQHNANHAFSLLFRNQADAATFVNTVLHLSHAPTYTWSTSLSSGAIYTISDGEPSPREYRAVELNQTRLGWVYSDLFYLYRHTDYAYDHASLRVRLPQAQYTDYISTHVDKLYKAASDAPPHFSHCEKKTGLMTIEFPDESAQDFMTALSAGFQLIFSRRTLYVTTKAPSRFGSSKSNKGHAEVQLWRKGNVTRLVSRWGDTVEDKWLSLAIPNGGINSARDTNKVIITGSSFEKGRVIDMAGLVARNPREEGGRKTGAVTVVFEICKDREEFAAVIEGREPKKQRCQVDDLMDMFK